MTLTDKYIDDVVISSRVRLARNLADYPFPTKLTSVAQAKEIASMVSSELNRYDAFTLYYMSALSEETAYMMREAFLISENLIENKDYGAVLINQDQSISIMINEEDHLREQYIAKGLTLEEGYHILSEIDDLLSCTIRFAYDRQFGYLTACPTNVGTGLRASVMVFLPALTKNKLITNLYKKFSKLGFTIRGKYGEGSGSEGYIYQISNEVTLGVSEEEIIEQVQSAVISVAELEYEERKKLNSADKVGVEDRCRRSYGILANCARLSNTEFMEYIANIKLGVSFGYLPKVKLSLLDDLIVAIQPANISNYFGRALQSGEMDVRRAELVGLQIRKIFEK